MTTLMLLPGLSGDGSLFRWFQEALPRELRTVAITYPTEPLGYAELTAWVRPRIVGIGPFALLGESFSGPVAAALAAERPDGLRACILCATFLRSPNPLLHAVMPIAGRLSLGAAPPAVLRWTGLDDRTPADCVAAIHAAGRALPRATFSTRLSVVARVDLRATARRIDVPTLYLRAARDRLVPGRCGDEVMACVPGAQRQVVDGPHFLLQARPRESARSVAAFLGGLPTFW